MFTFGTNDGDVSNFCVQAKLISSIVTIQNGFVNFQYQTQENWASTKDEIQADISCDNWWNLSKKKVTRR